MSGMPCGECPVCEDEVDHADAGFCKVCGSAFHWRGCGGWFDLGTGRKHVCNNCQENHKDDET